MTRDLRAAGALLTALALVATPARAATVRVPADAPTIAAGLAAAAASDTVLVAPGTYAERVVLPSRVTLRVDGAPGAATIDAGRAGTCVDVALGAPGTRLEGFRLAGGSGAPDGGSTVGGALRVVGGSLYVRDCTFDAGQATFGGGTAGVGAAIDFHACAWTGTQATYGGGHFQSGGSVDLFDVAFTGAKATSGGGVFATNNASVTVSGARFENVQATADGAGMRLDLCVATVSNACFIDAVAGGRGGGIAVAAGGQVLASYCSFLRNASGGGGGAFHVSCDAAASRPPGGLLAADCALLSLTHADILSSGGAAPAAGAVTGAGVVRLRSSIVVGNASGLACLDSRATLDVTCSDLYANGGGDLGGNCAPALDPSNRAVDPYLCDLAGGDLGLCANSPLAGGGCGDGEWGVAGVTCGACGPTPAAATTWGRIKVRYR